MTSKGLSSRGVWAPSATQVEEPAQMVKAVQHQGQIFGAMQGQIQQEEKFSKRLTEDQSQRHEGFQYPFERVSSDASSSPAAPQIMPPQPVKWSWRKGWQVWNSE